MTNGKLYDELIEMGDRWYYIAILTVLNFLIPLIPGIISFIFMILILGNAKRIAQELNDKKMKEFRQYYIYGLIITILGVVVLIIFAIIMFSFMIAISNAGSGYVSTSSMYSMFIPLMGATVGLLIILIIGGYFQIKAFGSLNEFFTNNQNLFPQHMRTKLIDGSKNLKNAAILFMLGFLVITALIGIILQIIGYFKLANLRDLKYSQGQPQQYQAPPHHGEEPQSPEALEGQPATPVSSSQQARFCPVCGARLEGDEKFCGKCGSEIDF